MIKGRHSEFTSTYSEKEVVWKLEKAKDLKMIKGHHFEFCEFLV